MKTIVLYGNSLAVSTIGASLAGFREFELVHVDAGRADTAARLSALDPVAVVFDQAATRLDFAVSLLGEHPHALLIGVDPSSDQLLVLSGRHEQPESAAGLVQAITASSGARSLDPTSLILAEEWIK